MGKHARAIYDISKVISEQIESNEITDKINFYKRYLIELCNLLKGYVFQPDDHIFLLDCSHKIIQSHNMQDSHNPKSNQEYTGKDFFKLFSINNNIQQEIINTLPEDNIKILYKQSSIISNNSLADWYIHTFSLESKNNLLTLIAVLHEIPVNESEITYKELVENTSDWVWEVNQTAQYTYVSPKIKDILGYEPHEVINKTPFELMPPDEAQRIAGVFQDIVEKKQPFSFLKNINIHKDGSHVVMETSGVPIFNQENVWLGYRGIDRDITQREKQELYLKKLTYAVEQAADNIFITDSNGIIEYVNPSFERITGYTKEEVLGKTPSILKSKHHQKIYYDELWKTILSGNVYRNVICNKSKDGQIFYEEKTITPIRNNYGEITHFISTGKDITEQMWMQSILDKIMKVVSTKTGKDFFQSLVLNLVDVLEVDYSFIAEITGEKSDQLQTLAVCAKNEIVSDFKFPIENTPCERLYEKEIILIERDTQKLYPDSQRLVKWEVEGYIGSPLINPQGEVLGTLVVMSKKQISNGGIIKHIFKFFAERATTELTRIKLQKEKELIQNQLYQAQKMDAIGTLASGIAHDFNNILNVIQGYTQLILLSETSSNPIFDDVKEIESAITRASRLIQQLLFFSRKQTNDFIPINIHNSIQNIQKMIQRILGSNIAINTNFLAQNSTVMADEGNLEQIILNMSINARDAMPGGGSIAITTRNVASEESIFLRRQKIPNNTHFVRISFNDSGCGIDKENIDRIFEPFFTTKDYGKGTGLGLSVVYGIVKNHKGFIRVNSTLGQGTTFIIYLPVTDQLNITKDSSNQDLNRYQVKDINVLLVEDEDGLRKFTARALKEFGYIVLETASAEEALEVLKNNNLNIELVFTDIILPGESGILLAHQISNTYKDIHVILTSGYVNEKSRQFINAGKNYSILEKPYSIEQLLKSFHTALKLS